MAYRQRARVIAERCGPVHWELATRGPAPHLRCAIRELQGYSERAPWPIVRREYPAPLVVAIIEFGPPIRIFDSGQEVASATYDGGFSAGISDSFTVTEHAGYQAGIQMNLTPLGARLIFGLPMSELTGRVVALRDILGADYDSLAEKLAEAPDWDTRFDFVEGVLSSRISRARGASDAVAWACQRIEASGGTSNVKALADELGYSQKHLIALFRDHVGVPPKLFSRIVRFARMLERVKADGAIDWADIALSYGYCDQAHLARDTKRFSGLTPTRLRQTLVAPVGITVSP